MARYCTFCGKVIIYETYLRHDDSCRCDEFQTYSTSDSSCIEKTLQSNFEPEEVRLCPPGSYLKPLPEITLTWRYNRDCDIWSCCYGPYHITIENGIDLWIYNGNQCEIFCDDPKEHMKAIRSIL